MALGDTPIGARHRPHGWARYRHDGAGGRVLVLPMHCPSGQHVLPTAGYRTTLREGVLHVQCTACAAAPQPNHSWQLKVAHDLPASAEFDDELYADLRRP